MSWTTCLKADCSIPDKLPATCPHCSAQFINQSVLDIHMQRCPTTEEEKNVGRGRGQGRGRCTGQVRRGSCLTSYKYHTSLNKGVQIESDGLKLYLSLYFNLFSPLLLLSISWPSGLLSSVLPPLSFCFALSSLLTLCLPQIECDLCGHRCMTQEGLDLHRLSHTGQTPLKCPVKPCRRRFTSNSTLEEHVMAHFQGTASKGKNQPRFRCQICLKEFNYNSTFNVHMRTHTDERPFEVRSGVCVFLFYTRLSILVVFPIEIQPSPAVVTPAHSWFPHHGYLCSVCAPGVSLPPCVPVINGVGWVKTCQVPSVAVTILGLSPSLSAAPVTRQDIIHRPTHAPRNWVNYVALLWASPVKLAKEAARGTLISNTHRQWVWILIQIKYHLLRAILMERLYLLST